MQKKIIFSLVTCILFLFSCRTKIVDANPVMTTNSIESIEKPYLILISLDGFRWDYVDRFNPPHLTNFINNGVKAESLIPSFPSKTFPNHYTIATGMYPENNGLVGNSFYSYEQKSVYSIGNRKVVGDGRFYKGTPIWVKADKEEMVSASYFFVGSEADIQGIRPTYYFNYDGSVKNEDRVDQAIDWLKLPAKERPHMITMYFSDMDDTGHKFGPNNDVEIKKGLFELDKSLGILFEGVKSSELPINIIIVSDHGMAEVLGKNYLPLEDIKNDSMYLAIDNGAIVNIHPKKENDIDSIYQYLKRKENNFKVYKTKDAPGFEYTPRNKDWGAIQIIPDVGYYFLKESIRSQITDPNFKTGVHGYNPATKDMHGIFYANGPAFKKGTIINSIKNIHIYPLMCEILELEIPNNIDGKLEFTEKILIDN